MNKVSKIFEPGKIGEVKIKNRLVFPAISTYCSTKEGYVTNRLIELYEERAKGGVGLIVLQGVYILYETPGSSFSPGFCDDSFMDGHRAMVARIHGYDTPVFLQLSHIGAGQLEPVRKAAWDRKLVAFGPSPVPFANTGLIPQEMTKKDIDYIEEAFSIAAMRAKAVGYDGVEIHACHSRLISMYLSPFYNKRTDEYGGSRENRARFACEIVECIKQKTGSDFPVVMKINGDDLHEGGSRIEDSVVTATLLEKAGADGIAVSGGSFGLAAPIPTYMDPTGVWVPNAEAIKKAVSIPVIALGNLDIPYGETVLQEGKADFIGLGRPLLADSHLPQKASEGRWDEVDQCIRCNNCMTTVARLGAPTGDGIRCTVNSGLCREKEFGIKPAAPLKNVLVVGGGLAGMMAARTLAERGHTVTLYEKEGQLGGQWAIASCQEDKGPLFSTLTDSLERGMEKAGVKIILNHEADLGNIREAGFDAAVLATGATSIVLKVPGVDGKNVVQATDLISGTAQTGEKVVVVGGRLRGLETAYLLAKQGKKVSLVTMNKIGENGIPLEHMTFWTVRKRLIDMGVAFFPHSPIREINEKGVYIYYDGDLVFIEADTVVLAAGAKPLNELEQEIKGAVDLNLEVHTIGDCRKVMDAMQATIDGAEIGRKI